MDRNESEKLGRQRRNALYEAARNAINTLSEAYDTQRARYYRLLRNEDARDWVVLLEPQLTIKDVWIAGVSSDSYAELERELRTMTDLLDKIEALVEGRNEEES